MPWSSSDAKEHTHLADTDHRKRLWRDVANNVLRQHDGEKRADEIAIRSANAAVAEDHRKEKSRLFANMRHLIGT